MEKKCIEEYLKAALAKTMECDVEDIDENTSFFKLGVTSIQALKVINNMRKALDVEINPAAIFEYKCIAELAEYLESLS
jgi:polyketide synthase PksL